MRLLLDTHVLLWALGDPDRLGDDARAAIVDPITDVLASAVSTWEVAIKGASGKLRIPDDFADHVTSSFMELPVTIRHSIEAGALPSLHGDPFDRMLIAQARIEGLTIVTRDKQFAPYGVDVLPA